MPEKIEELGILHQPEEMSHPCKNIQETFVVHRTSEIPFKWFKKIQL
jgi:hypothetical protein